MGASALVSRAYDRIVGSGASTRERILGGALSLFATRGFSATSVDDIATAAGLAPRSGAVYRHFPTKQAILDAVVESYLARLERAKVTMRAVQPVGSEAPDLRLTARWMLHEIREERPLLQIIERDPDSVPALRARLAENVTRGYAELAEFVQLASGRSDLDAEAVGVAILGILENYDRSLTTYGVSPGGIGEDRLVNAWVDLVSRLLAPGKAPGSTAGT